MNKHILTLTLLYIVFIIYIMFLANSGQANSLFDVINNIPYGDKFGHAILFGLMASGLSIATNFSHYSIIGFKLYTGAIVIFLFALAEEFSQVYLPNRTFDLIDLFASFIGIFSFPAISYKLIPPKNRQNQQSV